MPGFTLVRFDDWEALYRTDTGEKLDEGHRLDVRDLLRLVEADCEAVFASEDFDAATSESGFVPDNLNDYPEGAF